MVSSVFVLISSMLVILFEELIKVSAIGSCLNMLQPALTEVGPTCIALAREGLHLLDFSAWFWLIRHSSLDETTIKSLYWIEANYYGMLETENLIWQEAIFSFLKCLFIISVFTHKPS